MMNTFELTVGTKAPMKEPSWSAIADALSNISSNRDPFVILSSGEDFVQALGGKNSLMIEWRVWRSSKDFSQFVIGRGALANNLSIVAITGSQLPDDSVCHEPAFMHEVLTLSDALLIFRSFHETLTVPKEYSLREISTTNLAYEQIEPGRPWKPLKD
jgi:hypothetical protein